jgi:hypothetical protein
MDPLFWATIVCTAITLIATGFCAIAFALASWCLLQCVKLGNDVATLQANQSSDKEENNRRFNEVLDAIQDLKRLFMGSEHRRREDDV